MNRNLGKMGENNFILLCSTVNLTATRPDEDKFGWDYFVEFPNEKKLNIPIDSQDTPIECKIQIKATDKNDGKCQIKLSAMYRLVKAQMPTFVCFMNFIKQNDVQELYLVHIDEFIISNVLKRVRECESKNILINKSKITIHYTSKHKIENISGVGLKNKIEESIKKGMSDYIKEKDRMVKAIGFDEQSISLKISFPLGTKSDDIIDMSLGLKESLSVNISDIIQKRFNIELPFENQLNGVAIVSMKPIPRKVVLSIRESEYSTPLEYNLDLYMSPFNNIEKEKSLKSLFKNEFITFIVNFSNSNDEHKFKFNFGDEEKKHSLDSLLNILKLVKLSHTHHNKPLILELKENSKSILKINISINKAFDTWMLEFYDVSYKLLKIYNYLEIPSNSKISFNESENNITSIKVLSGLLFENIDSLQINCTLDESVEGNKIAILMPSSIFVNNKVIGIFFIFISNFSSDGKAYVIKPFERRIYETFIIDKDDFYIEYFNNLIDKIDKDLEKEDILSSFYYNKYLYLPN